MTSSNFDPGKSGPNNNYQKIVLVRISTADLISLHILFGPVRGPKLNDPFRDPKFRSKTQWFGPRAKFRSVFSKKNIFRAWTLSSDHNKKIEPNIRITEISGPDRTILAYCSVHLLFCLFDLLKCKLF